MVHQLKRDFPGLTIAINGGITSNAQIASELQHVDGVMVGREAYHNPWVMAEWDAAFFGAVASTASRESIEEQMCDYMAAQFAIDATPWSAIARHMLGLRHGMAGSRRWRQVWSDHRLKTLHPHDVMALAHGEIEETA
jgi:tRNA-dihydrouridine synthase A